MMRCFGFEDCLPVGDAGLVKGLERFFALPARPDANATRELMQVFSPTGAGPPSTSGDP